MRVIFLPETDHVSLVSPDTVHFPPWAVAGQKPLNLETKMEYFDEERGGAIVQELECIPNWDFPNYIYHPFSLLRILDHFKRNCHFGAV